ncbi:MAG: flagellar hook-basal body complex protein FliE [Thermodesulfovibrio sp.]|nr:flagellar hook-basal body complex protein FliE [Thermodesulfovibrio sp.]
MSDLKISGAGISQNALQSKVSGSEAGAGFDAVLKDAVGKVTEVQSEAERAITELASGGDVTQAIIAMEKADMSFQTMIEVRNRLLTAYEEVMRMQI